MNKRLKTSIQKKLTAVFLLTSVIIFAVNLLIYNNVNRMLTRIDEIYLSNVNLNELQATLNRIQDSLTEYLVTKNSDSMEKYYSAEQDYNHMLESLNTRAVSDGGLLLEKNIEAMSRHYLSLTSQTVEAKRGRNIERYRVLYEKARELCGYINTYIYSLNNVQFQNNTADYETMLAILRFSEAVNMVILVMVAALNVLLILLLTESITGPLKRLAEAANEVSGGGTLDIEPVEVKTTDEVGVVTAAFNQMLLSIREYIEKLKKSMELESELKEKELLMETHLKDAQLKYLQAQINPHFLFNTLNAGAQLAMMEDAQKTYTYVQNVADFFRYNVKRHDGSVTLQDEIELVDNYVYILNVRFSGEIHFEKHVDERFLQVQMPSMILQPIVENAIQYGIRGIEWEGKIMLFVYEEDGHVTVSIRDNGNGMSQESIAAVMEGQVKEELGDGSNGVGLGNVIGRLRLFCGREDVMEITSLGEGLGTEVAIFIPTAEREEYDV